MQKYQPEFIEAEQIESILKSCIPFIEEKAGRYWLDRMYSNIGPLGAVTTRADNRKALQILIAEGLNSIEETGDLERVINIHKERIRKIQLIQCANIAKYEYNSNVLFKEISAHDLWELDGESTFDDEMAIALFTAWQKARGAGSGDLDGVSAMNNRKSADPPEDVQKALGYLSDYLILMNDPIDGYRRYYAKGKIKDLPLKKDHLYGFEFYRKWIYNPTTRKPVSKSQLEKAYWDL